MMRKIFFSFLLFLPITLLAQDNVPMTAVIPADSFPVSEKNVDSLAVDTLANDSLAPAIRFGYLSYETVLKGMFDYADAQDSIQAEREAYEKELRRVEKEFNKKYESFLEGQRDFPRTILLKRQNELKDLMQQNIDFKAQAHLDLQAAEERFLAPVRQRLNAALADIAKEYGLAFVLNTDANACPFIDPLYGMDIQSLVEEYLK